ncbi:MAG: sigma-70 family RNA polymerase sigma factor [Planctomycetia bacterium]|nr:sigma-70 family RNA polymerase sigma factor [Planctomycetia bacterium]
MDAPETQRLVQAALVGGPDALAPLIERLRPRLVLWCAARMSQALRAHTEPEDAAQDVLMAVLKDFHTYSGPPDRQFFGWFFTVAANKMRDLVDYWAAKKRQPGERAAMSQTSPSQAAARRELAQIVRDAVGRLPEDYRTVVSLLKFEGRDIAEVAQIMDRTPNAVRILYCRALKELRELIDTDGGTSTPRSNGA